MPDRATIAATPKCPDCGGPMEFLPGVTLMAEPAWRCLVHGPVAVSRLFGRLLASA